MTREYESGKKTQRNKNNNRTKSSKNVPTPSCPNTCSYLLHTYCTSCCRSHTPIVHTHIMMSLYNATVMVPTLALRNLRGEVTDRGPSVFTGKECYRSFRNDVELWSNLTNPATEKKGQAMLGCLRGEAKNAAYSLSIKKICSFTGLEYVLAQLHKSYAVDESSQLDSDLSASLDYPWDKRLTVKEVIARFHATHDKVGDLEFLAKLKSHVMLRHAGKDHNEHYMTGGPAFGYYNV